MAPETESGGVEALVEEGLQLYSQGHLLQALAKWREALDLEPGHPRAKDYISYVEDNRSALEASFQLTSVSTESPAVEAESPGGETGQGGAPEVQAEDGEEPPGEEPPEDKSGTGEPKTDEPETDEPKADEPETDEPETDEPKADDDDDGEAETTLEIEAEAPPRDEPTPAAAMTAQEAREVMEKGDPKSTLPLPGIVEPTARIDLEALQTKLDQTKAPHPTPALSSPAVEDGDARRDRKATPLMVVPGDGQPPEDGFEPLEQTPVGEVIPEPARLVVAKQFEGKEKTPVVVPPADLFEDEPATGKGADAEDGGDERASSMLSGAHQLHDQGTYEGSLWLCERVLGMDPGNAEAKDLLEKNRTVLLEQSWSQIGDLTAVPVIQIPQHEIMWHKLDHRAGFLLSRIDGQLSFEEVIDVSGMGEFEASRILSQLMGLGVIGPRR